MRPALLLIASSCCLAMASCSSDSADPEPEVSGVTAQAQVLTEKEQLAEHIALVQGMDVVDWHAEMFDAHPTAGGELVAELSGTFFSASGDGRVVATITGGGSPIELSYLIAGDRIYMHADSWGSAFDDCWAEATDHPELLRILPRQLDPRWILGRVRPVRIRETGLETAVRADDAVSAMPRHAYLRMPRSVRGSEVDLDVASVGDGLRLELDASPIGRALHVAGVPPEEISSAGSWWTLDLTPSNEADPVEPPAPKSVIPRGGGAPTAPCGSLTS